MNYQKCPICTKEFKVYTGQKRHYCSMDCLKVGYKTQLLGENNPNYRNILQKMCEICGAKISKNAKSKCPKCNTTGENNPFYGKTHSQETKDHLSEIRKGKDLGNWRGRKHKDETKAKISRCRKEEWENLTDEERKIKLENLMKGVLSQLTYKETTPEKEISNILNECNISYVKNHRMYNKFFVDFYIEKHNAIIEVFGDYWHCHPKKFPVPNEHQIKQMAKDKSRLAYLKKCGHEVLVLWENEIKINKAEVSKKIAMAFGIDKQLKDMVD